jgi:tetratricopeptide (TPR) repeat protein
MPGKRAGMGRQRAAAGHDANVAGRDLFIVNLGSANAGEAVVPGLLPRDVPGFTGRQVELDRLAALAGRGGSVVVTAISGTAGVGKTALAVHAAHQLLPQFPDGHLYMDLRGYTEGQSPAAPGEVLEMFLRRLGISAEDVPVGVEERSGVLRQLLASRRVVMLLDNVSAEAQVRPLLPGAGGSLVLITSRSALPGLEVDERVGLDVLPEDEATVLLAGLIGPDRAAAEPGAVEQVRDWCGCLPLALRIAGQLLSVHQTWPVGKLADMLADERDRLEQLSAGDLQVRTAFMASYRQLAETDARTFRLLGLHPGPDIDVPAAARLAGIDREKAQQILDRLTLAHLILEGDSGRPGWTAPRFAMHDLLRLFARETCQETDSQATRGAALNRLVNYFSVLAGFLDDCISPERFAADGAAKGVEPRPSPGQALAVFEIERPNLLAIFDLAARRDWYENVWKLSIYMARALTLRRHLDDLVTVCESALAATKKAGNTTDKAEALSNLGSAYRRRRRFEEAIACHQRALENYRETGDQPGEGRALNHLGNVYQDLRRSDEAIASLQDALVIFRETGDQHAAGVTLGSLASAYRRVGRLEEAVSGCEEDLAIRQETGDRHGEGEASNNLGNVHQELGRLEEAVGCFQDALVIFRETGDQHAIGVTLGNLGSVYRRMGGLKQAIACHHASLTVFQETGDQHGAGLTLGNLGNVYLQLRQPAQAASYWRAAAEALHETADHEEAARHDLRAAIAQLAPARHRWWRRR